MTPMDHGAQSSVSERSHFLDLPIDAAFRQSADGAISIYPWPWPVRVGSVLPGADAELKLRSMMRRWLYAAMPAFILFGLIEPQAIVALCSAYVAAYYMRMLIALRGLPRTFERPAIEIVHRGSNRRAQSVAVETDFR